jgi:hypothetical protein
MKHCVGDHYQDCSNHCAGVKIGPALGVINFHYVHIVKKNKNKTMFSELEKARA